MMLDAFVIETVRMTPFPSVTVSEFVEPPFTKNCDDVLKSSMTIPA